MPNREISWFVYVVLLPEGTDRARVQAELARQGIATGRYFAPLHLQPALRVCTTNSAALSLTEAVARRALALPFFNHLAQDQQLEVAEALRAAIACAE